MQSGLVDMVSSDEERALERDMAKGVRLGLGIAQLSAGQSQEAIATFRLILADDVSFVSVHSDVRHWQLSHA